MRYPRIVPLLALVAAATVLAIAFVFAPRHAPHAVGLGLHAAPATRSAAHLLARDEVPLQPAGVERVPIADDAPADTGSPPSATAPPRAATLAELQDFRAYVAETLTGLRAEEAAGELRALEERAARLDEFVADFATRLALTAPQVDRLRSALLSRFDREAEYVRLWENGADEGVLAELKTSDREVHVAELSAFLSPDQLETYLALDP